MRLVKDAHEQDIMRRAADISARAHIRAMQTSARMLRAGQEVREYHLDAELLHEFRLGGSQYPAYGSIVAAGAPRRVLAGLAVWEGGFAALPASPGYTAPGLDGEPGGLWRPPPP